MGRNKGKCRTPKRKPYGTTGTDPYCRAHDCHSVYVVSKGAERAKAKKEARDAPREPEYDEREYIEDCGQSDCPVCLK